MADDTSQDTHDEMPHHTGAPSAGFETHREYHLRSYGLRPQYSTDPAAQCFAALKSSLRQTLYHPQQLYRKAKS